VPRPTPLRLSLNALLLLAPACDNSHDPTDAGNAQLEVDGGAQLADGPASSPEAASSPIDAHVTAADADVATPDGGLDASEPRTDGGLDASSTDADTMKLGDASTVDAASIACAGPCPVSKIKHLVVIVQENHTFDDHFGRYCTASTGSNPACTTGPDCCERAPDRDPSGATPVKLDDLQHASYDPNHTSVCELSEMNGGKMDRYATGASCSSPSNVVLADPAVIKPLWDLAKTGALADRWFQPLAGQSSANDMYFARAQFVFNDNAFSPKGAVGDTCTLGSDHQLATGKTLADLLDGAGVPWAWYGEGYDAMAAAEKKGSCPAPASGCPLTLGVYPCTYDPSDNPFQYYASSQDKPASSRDFTRFGKDLADGELPAVSFVKGYGFRTEHPGYLSKLSDGMKFITQVVSAIDKSAYARDTLILVTYDEGGGYFDHMTPPADNVADHQPYGTRVPTLALGPFAKKNYVSHVVMEHSSVVRFVEWNWLNEQTGQLGGRDQNVANLGSLLDATATGVAVPE
jgi:phospholipase C